MIFDDELEAKVIHRRAITAPELRTYFEVYVKMFQADGKSFPKAMTMLDATAEASNRNAQDLALKIYKQAMDHVLKDGPGGRGMFMKEVTLRGHHETAEAAALTEFASVATLGSDISITTARHTLQEHIETERLRCFELNEMRNPFRDLEMYAVPILVATVGWGMATLVDVSCSHAYCEVTQSSFEKLVRVCTCQYMNLLFISSLFIPSFLSCSICFVHLECSPWPYVIHSPILSCIPFHSRWQPHHGLLLPFLMSLVVLKHAKKRNLRSKKSIFISFFVPLFLLTRTFPDHLRISKNSYQ